MLGQGGSCFASSYVGLPTDGTAYETVTTLRLTGDLASMSGLDVP